MVITEVPIELDSTQWAHEEHQRSGGLHLSHVVSSIERNIWRRDKGDGYSDQDLEPYRMGGFLFERAIYDNLLKMRGLERLGEFELDDIILTPDAVDLNLGVLLETKFTWQSMPTKKNKKDITDFENWMVQIKAYCKALGVRKVELWVFFVNGGYGEFRKPVLRRWDMEFTQAELDQNWRMIVNHAKWMWQKQAEDVQRRIDAKGKS